MKLYATTTSERASKGQGGNEYLKIIVRDEKQHCIGYITFIPGRCDISIIKDIDSVYEKVECIGTNDDMKTKIEKANDEEICIAHGSKYIERHKIDGHYICRACIVDKVIQRGEKKKGGKCYCSDDDMSIPHYH